MNIGFEIEEFGDDCLFVNVSIEYSVTPGEAPVYYPNDRAYPGSSPEVELKSVHIVEAYDEDDNEVEVTEELVLEVEEYLEDNYELWWRDAIEHADDY